MMLRTPNWREKLLKDKRGGEDPLVDILLEKPDSEESRLFAYVDFIHDSHVKKRYVEASLLTSAPFDEIAEVLDIPAEVIQMYADIYYDVIDLDRLSKLDLVDSCTNHEDRVFKLWSMSQGMNFIAWRLGKRFSTSAVEGLTDLFNDCIYKAKEAFFNPNATVSSKESTKWVKLAIEIAKLLKMWVTDSTAAKKDIELALRQVIPEFKTLDQLDDEDFSIEPTTVEPEVSSGETLSLL